VRRGTGPGSAHSQKFVTRAIDALVSPQALSGLYGKHAGRNDQRLYPQDQGVHHAVSGDQLARLQRLSERGAVLPRPQELPVVPARCWHTMTNRMLAMITAAQVMAVQNRTPWLLEWAVTGATSMMPAVDLSPVDEVPRKATP
jgi:hypothetical protein